jgi:Leucine-rich repeat (LRR) protein
MKRIYRIDLSSNAIKKIEDGAFDTLVSLEILNLDQNKELSLGDGTFGQNGLIHLTNLHLSKCNLKTLPTNLLKNMP